MLTFVTCTVRGTVADRYPLPTPTGAKRFILEACVSRNGADEESRRYICTIMNTDPLPSPGTTVSVRGVEGIEYCRAPMLPGETAESAPERNHLHLRVESITVLSEE